MPKYTAELDTDSKTFTFSIDGKQLDVTDGSISAYTSTPLSICCDSPSLYMCASYNPKSEDTEKKSFYTTVEKLSDVWKVTESENISKKSISIAVAKSIQDTVVANNLIADLLKH